MSQQAARTPGAKRAGNGEYVFDLTKVNHILGGPDYSTANGACVEGERMIVALMRMPAGTGAEPHSHPNEQWIYVLQGTFRARIGEQEVEAKAGSVIYVPANVVFRAKRRRTATSSSLPARMRPTACTASRRPEHLGRGATTSRGRRPVSGCRTWVTMDAACRAAMPSIHLEDGDETLRFGSGAMSRIGRGHSLCSG